MESVVERRKRKEKGADERKKKRGQIAKEVSKRGIFAELNKKK